MKGATVSVQGFGKVGWNAARILHGQGCRIVALSDSKGGIYNSNGLSPFKVHEHKKKSGSVVDYKGGENITNRELLETE